jgi:putative aldouronate transport system substrate-binding protein
MESFDGKLIVDYMTGKDNSDGGQHVYTKLLALNLLQENGSTADQLQVYNPAPTETMTLAWTNLTDMENTLFVKIVRGNEPLEAFDQFVKDWYAQGGQAITEEVDAQAKGK